MTRDLVLYKQDGDLILGYDDRFYRLDSYSLFTWKSITRKDATVLAMIASEGNLTEYKKFNIALSIRLKTFKNV